MPGLAFAGRTALHPLFPTLLCNARHPFRTIERMPLQPPFCHNLFRMRSYKRAPKVIFLSPLECAVTSSLCDNSFRIRSYKKQGGGGTSALIKILRSLR